MIPLLFDLAHQAVTGLLLLTLVCFVFTLFACTLRQLSRDRLTYFHRILIGQAGSFTLTQVLYYCLGRSFIIRGELTMTPAELILSIATMMHRAAIAFIVAALVTVFCIIYAAVSRKGNVADLKKLLTTCVFISVMFWVLSWLII